LFAGPYLHEVFSQKVKFSLQLTSMSYVLSFLKTHVISRSAWANLCSASMLSGIKRDTKLMNLQQTVKTRTWAINLEVRRATAQAVSSWLPP
jgi:hypothetical protein